MTGLNCLHRRTTLLILVTFFIIVAIGGCSTYYYKLERFHDYVATGKLEKAQTFLESDYRGRNKRNEILHHLNKGWVDWMLQDYDSSLSSFTAADRMIENFDEQPELQALSLLTNPRVKPYEPEDFEKVMLNYFKATDYQQMDDWEAALVEARKINLKLREMNDQYKDHKNRYKRDAFAHLYMGLLYDAAHDYNNAFIAYRNAYEVYSTDYLKHFGLEAPEQLKHDILRTAHLTGFPDEVDFYEREFNIDYKPERKKGTYVVFLWQNGFGPVKAQWSITFTKITNEEGWVTFTNEKYGISFPFYIGDKQDKEKSALEDLEVIRIAFPKYVERKPYYTGAGVRMGDTLLQLEKVQDINKIAFKSLHDRMLRELANSLLRLATKKAVEKLVENQNEGLGAAVSLINAISEQADTRNWQTLPYSIHYCRIPVEAHDTSFKLITRNQESSREQSFKVNLKPGQTRFINFQTLDTYPPSEKNDALWFTKY